MVSLNGVVIDQVTKLPLKNKILYKSRILIITSL